MSIATNGGTVQKRSGRCFVVLALFALSVVLASPVCDAYEPSPGIGHSQESDSCCASLHEPAPFAGSHAMPVTGEAAVASPSFAVAPPQAVARAGVPPRWVPPRSLRYHVRSARILA